MNKVFRTAVQVMLLGTVLGMGDDAFAEENVTDSTIKLRVVAVNPSVEKTQTVPIKIYLPKEVIPDDIIDMGELKVGFDSDKSLYFAYSDGVDLAPQETRVFEVHLEDVWKVKGDEISKIKSQTERALKHLENSEYHGKAKEIVDSINQRLDTIVEKQNDIAISREEHIGAYRMNLKAMESIRQDIGILEKLLQHTGAPPSIEFLKDTVFEKKDHIDRITAWKLILAILGFIGLLAVGFYVKWFLALKSRRVEKKTGSGGAVSSVSETVETGKGPQSMEASDEAEEVDIEKLMEPEDKKKKAG